LIFPDASGASFLIFKSVADDVPQVGGLVVFPLMGANVLDEGTKHAVVDAHWHAQLPVVGCDEVCHHAVLPIFKEKILENGSPLANVALCKNCQNILCKHRARILNVFVGANVETFPDRHFIGQSLRTAVHFLVRFHIHLITVTVYNRLDICGHRVHVFLDHCTVIDTLQQRLESRVKNSPFKVVMKWHIKDFI